MQATEEWPLGGEAERRSGLAADGTGHASVVFLKRAWYVLAESAALRDAPLPVVLMETPLVLFRDAQGHARAVLDRCPHRMVRLSLGKVQQGELECAYHGWRFDGAGRCTAVPGLCSTQEARSRDVPAYATRERDGYVWVWATAAEEPDTEPFRLRTSAEDGYTFVRRSVEFGGSLHATVENALDVPHTAYLHRGLFRGGREPVEIQAVLTRTATSVQAEFIGEPRPEGMAAKLLSPRGGVVTHFDRFFLPGVAEVEYRLGEDSHIVTTTFCTPVEAFRTRVFATVSLKTPLPGWLIRPVLEPLAMRIFKQDARILAEQTDAIRRWGGERFQNTEIDLIGAQVWRLLKRAEKDRAARDDEEDARWRKEVRLRV